MFGSCTRIALEFAMKKLILFFLPAILVAMFFIGQRYAQTIHHAEAGKLETLKNAFSTTCLQLSEVDRFDDTCRHVGHDELHTPVACKAAADEENRLRGNLFLIVKERKQIHETLGKVNGFLLSSSSSWYCSEDGSTDF